MALSLRIFDAMIYNEDADIEEMQGFIDALYDTESNYSKWRFLKEI